MDLSSATVPVGVICDHFADADTLFLGGGAIRAKRGLFSSPARDAGGGKPFLVVGPSCRMEVGQD